MKRLTADFGGLKALGDEFSRRARDANGTGRCKRFDARRDIRRIADRAVLHVQIAADGADDDGARVESDAGIQVRAQPIRPAIGQRRHLGLDIECRMRGSLGVVVMRDRCAEDRHESVARQLVNNAFVAMHATNRVFEVIGQQFAVTFGTEFFGNMRASREIAEHDGDLTTLALNGSARRKDFLRQAFRYEPGSRRGIRSCNRVLGSRRVQRGAALIAESRACYVFVCAARTNRGERRSTPIAKARVGRVLILAGRAVHGSISQVSSLNCRTDERGRGAALKNRR